MTGATRVAVIGCGGMARHHLQRMLQQPDGSGITVVCEPSPVACAATVGVFAEAGLRMALLWDTIKPSAAQNGMPVQCSQQSGTLNEQGE